MYSLRTILDTGEQMNVHLGSNYSLVDRFTSYDVFCDGYELYFKEKHVADLDPKSDDNSRNTIAFVIDSYGKMHPIKAQYDHFIVTDSGQTYHRINRAEKKLQSI